MQSYASCLFSSLLRCCSCLLCLFFLCRSLLVLQLFCCVSLSTVLGSCSPFYPVHICSACWNSLSVLVHAGIACLASLACDWPFSDWCLFKGVHCKLWCEWLLFYTCLTAQMVNQIVECLHTLLISNYSIAHSSNSFRITSGRQ